MRSSGVAFVVGFGVALGTSAMAVPDRVQRSPEALVAAGLVALQDADADAAARVWCERSSAAARARVAKTAEGLAGRIGSNDVTTNVVASQALSPQAQVVYGSIETRHVRLWLRFVVVRPDDDWTVSLLHFGEGDGSGIVPDPVREHYESHGAPTERSVPAKAR